MAQKPLVDSDELRVSLGIMDHPDVISSLDRAIIGAQIYFEEVLQTKLMRQSNLDNFNIDPTVIYIVPDGYYRLRLRNSFVRDPIVVTLYDTYPALAMDAGGVILDPAKGDYFVDKVKGVVHVNRDRATNINIVYKFTEVPKKSMFVKVTYESGFSNKAEAPEWLREALSAYVPSLITQKQITNRAPESAEIYKIGKEHAFTLMEPYLRDVGFTFRALA